MNDDLPLKVAETKPLAPGPKDRMNVWGYLDETGSLNSTRGGKLFGLGLLVTPSPRELHKKVTDLRSNLQYSGEFKFSAVRTKNVNLYKKLLDVYFASVNCRFSCRIYLRDNISVDLTKPNQVYKVYNYMAGKLICSSLDKGNYSPSDYIAVIADDISTRIDDNFEKQIRELIKVRLRRNALFGMSRAESHAFSELQLCDVLLGTIAYAFKLKMGLLDTEPNEAKQDLVKHLQKHLNLDTLAGTFVTKQKLGHRFEAVDKTAEK